MDSLTIAPAAQFLRYRYFSLFLGIVGTFASFVWMPLLIAFAPVASRPAFWLIFVVLTVMVLATAAAVAVYQPYYVRSLRYRFEPERFVAEGGVFFRRRSFIPYGRITDIRIDQGPIQRRYGIFTAFVQTAGAGVAEAALQGMDKPDEVRAMLLERKAMATGDATGSEEENLLAEVRAMHKELVAIRHILERK
jgi:hypothetical protein